MRLCHVFCSSVEGFEPNIVAGFAQVKMLNVLRFGTSWKLTDLDGAVPFDDVVTAKSSFKISPPEAFCWKDNVQNGIVIRSQQLKASPTFDMWSLGVCLYETLSHRAFLEGSDDAESRSSQEALSRLASWDIGALDNALLVVNQALQESAVSMDERLAVIDVLAWLLQPKSENRPQSVREMRQHAFFTKSGTWRQSNVHLAAARGDLASVQTASEIEKTSADHPLGKTPLHSAAEELQENIVLELLGQFQQTEAVPLEEGIHRGVSGRRFSRWREARASILAMASFSKHSPARSDVSVMVNHVDATGSTPLHSLLKGASSSIGIDGERKAIFLRICEILALDVTVSDLSGRSVFDIACASKAPELQALFFRLQNEQIVSKRTALFHELMLCEGGVGEPWCLEKGKLQQWLLQHPLTRKKQFLRALVDAMDDVSGLIVLSLWTSLSGSAGGSVKISKEAVDKYFPGVKVAATADLGKCLGVEALGYYRAILLRFVFIRLLARVSNY